MSETLIQYQKDGPLAIIQLDFPPANCYSHDMMLQLDTAILEARFDEDVHVIVLRGAGDKFFCAGADISMLNSVTPRFKYYFCLHANETLNRLEQTPKLTIAALNGHCVGGGLEVALACDLRVAASGAGKIGLPEVNLGVLPGTGGTQRLVRVLGRARAMEWLTTGITPSFDEAREVGLVNHVWEREGFWEQALDYARSFCPPTAQRRPLASSSAAWSAARKSAFTRGSPSNASSSNSCSSRKTRARASPHTWKSASRSSAAARPLAKGQP